MSSTKVQGRVATKSGPGAATRKNPKAKATPLPEVGGGKTGNKRWWNTLLTRKRPIGSIYGITPIDRIGLVRDGVPAEAMAVIAGTWHCKMETLCDTRYATSYHRAEGTSAAASQS